MLELIGLFNEGKYEEMETRARAILKKRPKDGVAWKALGAAVKKQDKDGLEATRKAVEYLPHDYEAHFNLGVELQEREFYRDAIGAYQKAISIKADSAKIWNNLGNALRSIGCLNDALQCYYRAIQIDPVMTEALLNLGNDLLAMGKYSKACDYFQAALDVDPDFEAAHSNMIFALDLMSTENTESQQNARKLWAAAYTDHIEQCSTHVNTLEPNRKLRIGYVGGDFRQHSAARVFGGMLVDYDREKFDVFCYDNKSQKDDEYTETFRKNTNFKVIHKLSDDVVFKMIQDDRIDILVDLAGHSGQNRLAVFAMKAAPVQVTAWGYATGTGIKAIDYFFTDAIQVPEDEKHFYAEQIVHLPCVASSWFPEEFPPVNELPALKNGYITFGCFNRLHKVTDECFQIWAEILNQVPNSRLILKAGELSDEDIRRNTMWQFARAGISMDRVILMGNEKVNDWYGHIKNFNLIDIALGPFPHGSGVTGMEGFRMGIPEICLKWPTIVGRLSSSLETIVGLPDWVAETANDYVKLAIEKAGDIPTLAKLRRELRTMFDESYLGNKKLFVDSVEKEYKTMWGIWCQKQYEAMPEVRKHGT